MRKTKNKYVNDITKEFDAYNNKHHYMCYDITDILLKELPIKTEGKTVGYVALTHRDRIFCIEVDTNLTIKYTDEFEKYISDKYMDKIYDYKNDIKE